MPRKICVVVTARPSYARIKSALRAIQAHPDLELQLVVAASALLDRYGNAVSVIREDGFEPASTVYMVVEGENLVTSAKSTGVGIMELATVFDGLKPDAVISIADRYETIATAVAGSFMNIPVVHVQGGEVTGSIDEKVRHAVTKLSDYHFVAGDHAAERVLRMGEQPERVFVTGCPSIDLAMEVTAGGDHLTDQDLRQGVGPLLDVGEPYLVVMQHPVTSDWDQAEHQISETLEAVRELNIPAFWFWPNVDAGSDGTSRGIRKFRERNKDASLRFMKNLPPEAFLQLLSGSRCLIGNSSTGIRESAFLGVPVVNIGDRQDGRERGPNVIDCDYDARAVADAARSQIEHGRYPSATIYGDGSAGRRIADLLARTPFDLKARIAY